MSADQIELSQGKSWMQYNCLMSIILVLIKLLDDFGFLLEFLFHKEPLDINVGQHATYV